MGERHNKEIIINAQMATHFLILNNVNIPAMHITCFNNSVYSVIKICHIPVIVKGVSLVYYGYPNAPESRPGGGLRLVFDDVVGGKAAAIADAPRGRDFHDLAHILLIDGWSLSRIEDALRNMNRGDQVQAFWESIENFRRGTFDDDIKRSGFDVAFCHSIIG